MLHVSRCSGCCSCVAVAVVVVQPLFLDALPLALPGSADNKTRLSPNAMFDYQNDKEPPETLGECGGCVRRHGLATEW